MNTYKKIFIAFSLLCVGIFGQAKVTLPQFYTDSMVVQRNATLCITGHANKNATVKVTPSWSNETAKFKADKNGKFIAKINTPEAGGPYTLTFDDGKKLVLDQVMSGDVWFCSGQSNMEMPLVGWGTMDSENVIATSTNPNIRLLYVKRDVSLTPRDDIRQEFGGWHTANPQSVQIFSAIGYFFGKELQAETNIPIGIIDCSWGGTPIESWMSLESIKRTGEMEDFTSILPTEENTLPAWDNSPRWIREQRSINSYPTVLYNAMVHPMQEIPIKGVLWYQGCSNVGRAQQYSKLFKSMIADWRDGWKQPDLPFYFVQIAAYLQPKWLQPYSEWANIRQAQADALELPNTAMVVATDLGNPDDIHPKNKQEVAHRLASIALNNLYGASRDWKAPSLKSNQSNGRYVKLTFDDEVTMYGGGQGFIICDENGKWYVANSRQTATNEIEVFSNDVSRPIEVRYNWADYPDGNLRSKSGLPVAPFKTKTK